MNRRKFLTGAAAAAAATAVPGASYSRPGTKFIGRVYGVTPAMANEPASIMPGYITYIDNRDLPQWWSLRGQHLSLEGVVRLPKTADK